MLVRLVVDGVSFEVLAVDAAAPPAASAAAGATPPPLPSTTAVADGRLLTPTIFTDAVGGTRASAPQLVAAFGDEDHRSAGSSYWRLRPPPAALAATAASTILSAGDWPPPDGDASRCVAARRRAVTDLILATYVEVVGPRRGPRGGRPYRLLFRGWLGRAADRAGVGWASSSPLPVHAAAVAAAVGGASLVRGDIVGKLVWAAHSRASAAAAAAGATHRGWGPPPGVPPPPLAALRADPLIAWAAPVPRHSVWSTGGPEPVAAAYRVGVRPGAYRRFVRRWGDHWYDGEGVVVGGGP